MNIHKNNYSNEIFRQINSLQARLEYSNATLLVTYYLFTFYNYIAYILTPATLHHVYYEAQRTIESI